VPKSRVRKKPGYTPPPKATTGKAAMSGRWVAPTMVTLFLLGLAWVVVYYLTSGAWPIGSIDWWNLVIGFTFIFAGLMVATRWK
jgi:hypothetical protein